jgi:flavin prenyltransferase
MRRLVVGISGASGSALGVRLLEVLREVGEVETHLVVSDAGRRTLEFETGHGVEEVGQLADVVHDQADVAAPIASGSFRAEGMVVAPCSMRTVAAIRNGSGQGLLCRAADVTLKERRRLVLVVREAPLSTIHLENMLGVSRAGAILCPLVPAFYNHPRTIEDVVDHTVGRVLDLFGIETSLVRPWEGPPKH